MDIAYEMEKKKKLVKELVHIYLWCGLQWCAVLCCGVVCSGVRSVTLMGVGLRCVIII